MALPEGKKYCKHCGEIIDEDCVVCPKCGKQVEAIGVGSQPIVINNTPSSSSSASSSASASVMQEGRIRRRYNHFLDFILIIFTGGLWIIWMLLRPKYY